MLVKKKNSIYWYVFIIIIVMTQNIFGDRSPHRPIDKQIPTLHARYLNDTTIYTLKNSHLEEVIFKVFDKKHFYENFFLKVTLPFAMIKQNQFQEKHSVFSLKNY